MIELDILDITTKSLYCILMVFCRVGCLIMLMPGIGQSYVPVVIRLGLALFISIAMHSLFLEKYSNIPETDSELFFVMIFEMFIGVLLGLSAKFIMMISDIAGSIISTQSGLSMLNVFDPSHSSQTSIFSVLYNNIALVLFFSFDFVILKGIINSFHQFDINSFFIGDVTQLLIIIMSKIFYISVQLSAPIIILTIILNIGAGIVSKLMPNIQVFFILSPVQLGLSILIVFLSISLNISWLMEQMSILINDFLYFK